MSNLAEVHDIAPHIEARERRVADTDDGYTRIANELMEELAKADITLHQYKVMFAIMRKTYGFNKKFDRITNTQIADMTGIPPTRVCTAKNRLIERGFLRTEGNCIGINKVVSEWKPIIPQNRETFPKTGNKTFPNSGNEASPKQGDTKDNLQKTINTNTPKPPEGDFSLQEKPPSKPKQTPTEKFRFDRDRFKDTWNRKADQFGLPRVNGISDTTEQGVTRLYKAHLKNCRENHREPRDIDTLINGYIEFGYTPSRYAMGDNPDGKKYGLETALRQRIIDQIISQDS